IDARKGGPVDIKLQLDYRGICFIKENIEQIFIALLVALKFKSVVVVGQRHAALLAALSRSVQARCQSVDALGVAQFRREGGHYQEGTADIETVVQFTLDILLQHGQADVGTGSSQACVGQQC